MHAGSVTRIEKNVDQAASALFGSACGYSAYLWLGAAGRFSLPMIVAAAMAIGLFAYLASFRVLSAVEPGVRKQQAPHFTVRDLDEEESEEFHPIPSETMMRRARPQEYFEEANVPPAQLPPPAPSGEPAELLLTEPHAPVEMLLTDWHEPADTAAPELELEESGEDDGLLLDDVLAKLGPDSRVVRLFDVDAMPTPGQLSSRIEEHLERQPTPVQSEEAAQALQDALAELRRSIPNRSR